MNSVTNKYNFRPHERGPGPAGGHSGSQVHGIISQALSLASSATVGKLLLFF